MKVKKYLPHLFMFIGFFGFLALQYSMELYPTIAKEQELSANKVRNYEKLYLKTEFKTNKGKRVDLKKIQKPIVILNFWASWCTPCLKEFPSLVDFYNKYKKDVFVLGLNNDEGPSKRIVARVERKYKLNFDSVLDRGSKITSGQFKILDIPTTLVFYKGKLVHHSQGDMNFMSSSFQAKIQSLLK